ncbi:unnamed protein product, partial [Allacma fusca]
EPVESKEVDTEGDAATADIEGKDHLKDILEGLPDFDMKKESEGADSSKAPAAAS